MADPPAAEPAINLDSILLIVVGAHLRAEMVDRPLAYRLRERILRWQDRLPPEAEPLDPVVCSDLWYLNNEELMEAPAIVVGGPGVNAATAFYANRLPIAFVVKDTLQVQLDVAHHEPWACVWGVDHATTVSAVDLFTERYLDGMLASVHGVDEESLLDDA